MTRPDELTLQDLYLGLLLRARAPIDGRRIARWLAYNQQHWCAAICGRIPQRVYRDVDATTVKPRPIRTEGTLRHLRSTAEGAWDADRLWLLPTEEPGAIEALVAEGRAWGAEATVGPSHKGELRTPRDLVTLRWETPKLPSAPSHTSAPPLATQKRKTPRFEEMTVAGIAIELLRRTRFNECDGARVARDLIARPDLWVGAWMGISDTVVEQDGVRTHAEAVFNTLEALPDEVNEGHNVDQLWVLCPSVEKARELVKLSKQGWRVTPGSTLLWSASSTRKTTGCAGPERVVSFWWD